MNRRELIAERERLNRELVALARADRNLTDEETRRVGQLDTQLNEMDARIAELPDLDAIRRRAMDRDEEINRVRRPAGGDVPPPPARDRSGAIRWDGRMRCFTRGPEDRENAHLLGMLTLADKGHHGAIRWCREHGVGETREMNTQDNAAGGILVPTEISSRIINLREQYGIFSRLSDVWPMTSDHTIIPRLRSTLTATPYSEGGDVDESDPVFDDVELSLRNWGLLTYYTNQLGEDAAVRLGDMIASQIAYAHSYAMDNAAINGDGSATYNKVVGVRQRISGVSGGAAGLFTSGNSTWATLTLNDFLSVKALLPVYAEQGMGTPVWIVSKAFFSSVMERLILAAGGLTAQDIRDGSRPRFLGYDVELHQRMPTATAVSTIHALLANLEMGCLIGERGVVEIATSSHVRFGKNQTAVRGLMRWDLNAHGVGTSSEAGPICALKTAA